MGRTDGGSFLERMLDRRTKQTAATATGVIAYADPTEVKWFRFWVPFEKKKNRLAEEDSLSFQQKGKNLLPVDPAAARVRLVRSFGTQQQRGIGSSLAKKMLGGARGGRTSFREKSAFWARLLSLNSKKMATLQSL